MNSEIAQETTQETTQEGNQKNIQDNQENNPPFINLDDRQEDFSHDCIEKFDAKYVITLPNKTKVKRIDHVKNQSELGYEEVVCEFFVDEPKGVNIKLTPHIHMKACNNFIYLTENPKLGNTNKYGFTLKNGTHYFNQHNPSSHLAKDTNVTIISETEVVIAKGSKIYLALDKKMPFVPVILGDNLTAKVC